MMNTHDRVLGSIIGASIGDALGGPLELASAAQVREKLRGKDRIEELLPYSIHKNPHGIWQDHAPRGTGTDDTRYNQIFLQSVIAHKGRITPEILAYEYISRFDHPERYYPGHAELAREQFRAWEGVCAGYLGISSSAYPGVPREALKSDCTWGGFPVITGLLTLAPAGMLWPADPDRAYRETFHLAFWDLGYARDATALMAAIISACFDDSQTPREILDSVSAINPYASIMNGFTGRQMTARLPGLMEIARTSTSDREILIRLAKACEHLHVFDPVDVLNVPLALLRYAKADPAQALLLAANHRIVDDQGELVRMRDTDCVGFVMGAIAGAMYGLEAFPKGWVDAVLNANQQVYGFDILQHAEDFYRSIRMT